MRPRRRLRSLAGIPLLAAVLAFAVWVPIPATGNGARRSVLVEVQERLPGWHIVRAMPAWEGAYSVVAACGGHELGFQMVPAHGLPVGDVWIQPDDTYAQDRLREVSDQDFYQVWYQNPAQDKSLSCGAELARSYPGGRSDGRPNVPVSRLPGVPRD